MTSADIVSKNNEKIVPFHPKKNVPNEDLVHSYRQSYIKKIQVKELAEKNYAENGRGITFKDMMTKFGVSKSKAQRKLKHFLGEGLLFTADKLTKEGIHLKGIKREKSTKILPNFPKDKDN